MFYAWANASADATLKKRRDPMRGMVWRGSVDWWGFGIGSAVWIGELCFGFVCCGSLFAGFGCVLAGKKCWTASRDAEGPWVEELGWRLGNGFHLLDGRCFSFSSSYRALYG
jgi:hypothetical protein